MTSKKAKCSVCQLLKNRSGLLPLFNDDDRPTGYICHQCANESIAYDKQRHELEQTERDNQEN